MATASNIVARALRLAGILAAGETASAADAQDGLDTLNDMLHGWALKGADIQHVTLAAGDTLQVPDSWLEGIRHVLALRIAPEYGAAASITDDVRRVAGEFMDELKAHLLEYDGDLKVDTALDPHYFSRRTGAYDIETG